LKRVERFSDRMMAEGAKSVLAASNIAATISGGDLAGTNPFLAATFGIDLLVDEEDLEAATQILRGDLSQGEAAPSASSPALVGPPSVGLEMLRGIVMLSWLFPLAGSAAAALGRPMDDGVMQLWLISWLVSAAVTFAFIWLKSRPKQRTHDADE
jgi:hypothetical protein